ncbi:tRNA (Uracil-5-)-methyltransferase [seawater metagenome]|uniref:tRNA (Uracil-5-)-methyltransferase n=1 Tax=seawater metagenome TaxID=1561972 RepID=A0A5E8CHM2_9ZZZZ
MELEIKVKNLKKSNPSFNFAEVFPSSQRNYRMRIECNLRINKNVLELDEFAKTNLGRANKKINDIVPGLLIIINKNEILKHKLFRIDFLCNQLNSVVIGLVYHKKLNEEWIEEASILGENIIGLSKKQKIVIGKDYVIERINLRDRSLNYKYTYGLFSQPNTLINQVMIQWILDHTKDFKDDLLELYCGCGNFSIALANNFRKVLASEIVKKSIKDAIYNIELNNVKNIDFVRMSSDEIEKAFNYERIFNRLSPQKIKSYNFSTVLVDPPRMGLTSKVKIFLRNFENIIYVSCNPSTLFRDLNELKDYYLYKSAIFDQFPGTTHIECCVILKKKKFIK